MTEELQENNPVPLPSLELPRPWIRPHVGFRGLGIMRGAHGRLGSGEDGGRSVVLHLLLLMIK